MHNTAMQLTNQALAAAARDEQVTKLVKPRPEPDALALDLGRFQRAAPYAMRPLLHCMCPQCLFGSWRFRVRT